MEMFHKRLVGCKFKLCLRGYTFLKSTRWSLPTYFMSIFIIPTNVASQLQKIMRDFLWSDDESNNGFHRVNWDDVCYPKHEGDLGVGRLQEMNEALKAKPLWRFAKDEEALWKKVIEMKYGVENFGWWSNKSSYGYGVAVGNQL